MALIHPTLHVSPELQAMLATGQLTRDGSVIRRPNGQIDRFLTEVSVSKAPLRALSLGGRSITSRELLMSGGALLVFSSVTAGIYIVQKKSRRAEVSANFKSAMGQYVQAIHDRNMTTKVIDELLGAWQDLQELNDRRLKNILNSLGFDLFLEMVRYYTEELILANSSLAGEQSSVSTGDVIDLTALLQHQQKIFDRAS